MHAHTHTHTHTHSNRGNLIISYTTDFYYDAGIIKTERIKIS